MNTDSFNTLEKASSGAVYKDKRSKFYGYAFPVRSPEEIKIQLDNVRKQNPSAKHVCYAWQIGVNTIQQRSNDDGEPHNSAGNPILGQITSFDITNVLVVVVRYYGGKKLGVGGLINAYRTAARSALDQAEVIQKELQILFEVSCSYDKLDRVIKLIQKNHWEIKKQELTQECKYLLAIRRTDRGIILQLGNIAEISIKEIPQKADWMY